ncbi:MAG: hypothetical protein ACXVZX_11425 [Terriglobales bacterium]
MRLGRLLLIVLLVVIVGRTAASQELKAEKKSDAASRADYVRPWVASNDFDAPAWASRPRDSRRVAGATEIESCLMLRTFIVAREDKESDAVRLVKQRTCTPSSQFQIKSAVVEPAEQK